eukprot:CAMPEP_0202972270 /NCGR_PEP_ID=MMETSP1396-20130829/34929_1 /ASSEMBLY_ACC=CAM_ASM_000872 /TAXON_ID= /ORGANISM="Pseudokeronopsis sp., Strain Brazil" /LENGTH=44 /DNA_ID= /DNA_START= /DNA_END= /DNA_ORIENTATION=
MPHTSPKLQTERFIMISLIGRHASARLIQLAHPAQQSSDFGAHR